MGAVDPTFTMCLAADGGVTTAIKHMPNKPGIDAGIGGW
jgi:hypothetical protein